jgi:drug/metabolite transporter (DMT)-like permease
LNTKKLLAALIVLVGLAIIAYASRDLILQASKSPQDFFAVVLLVVVCVASVLLSQMRVTRIFIDSHSAMVLKVGIAMLLLALLSPFVLGGVILFFPASISWTPPERFIEPAIFLVAAVGIFGFVLAMMPAYLKLIEHFRSVKR